MTTVTNIHTDTLYMFSLPRPKISIEQKALDTISYLCDGDARTGLNSLQLAVQAQLSLTRSSPSAQNGSAQEIVVTEEHVKEGLQRSHILYDKAGKHVCTYHLHVAVVTYQSKPWTPNIGEVSPLKFIRASTVVTSKSLSLKAWSYYAPPCKLLWLYSHGAFMWNAWNYKRYNCVDGRACSCLGVCACVCVCVCYTWRSTVLLRNTQLSPEFETYCSQFHGVMTLPLSLTNDPSLWFHILCYTFTL